MNNKQLKTSKNDRNISEKAKMKKTPIRKIRNPSIGNTINAVNTALRYNQWSGRSLKESSTGIIEPEEYKDNVNL